MIHKLNWNMVAPSVASDWFQPSDQVIAIWPSPVDHDTCFLAAGFDEFDNIDDRWDAGFEGIAAHSRELQDFVTYE